MTALVLPAQAAQRAGPKFQELKAGVGMLVGIDHCLRVAPSLASMNPVQGTALIVGAPVGEAAE